MSIARDGMRMPGIAMTSRGLGLAGAPLVCFVASLMGSRSKRVTARLATAVVAPTRKTVWKLV